MIEFTNEMKLKAAKRELALRKKAYPKWVAQGSMPPEVAKYEIEAMQAIVNDYAETVQAVLIR